MCKKVLNLSLKYLKTHILIIKLLTRWQLKWKTITQPLNSFVICIFLMPQTVQGRRKHGWAFIISDGRKPHGGWSLNMSLDMRASLCKSSAAFLWLGRSDNGAESEPELRAWENVKGGMCGGNTVCPDGPPESALCPFWEKLCLYYDSGLVYLH